MVAVKLSFTWFGTRKTLSADQRAQAADAFNAEEALLSASKKLLDTRHQSFRRVSEIRSRAAGYWRESTLPFPEPGVRLLNQDRIDAFNARMTQYRSELLAAAADLALAYEQLKRDAQSQLGRLYNEADYPATLDGLFDMTWEFPAMEPPQFLMALSPDTYRQEQQRVAARFQEAVTLAEQSFATELGRLVSHLAERLTGTSDGQPKIFRDSAVENLQEFIQRFQQMNIRSSQELESLVQQARNVISGIGPQELRTSASLRETVARDVQRIEAAVGEFMADRPRRNILRRAQAGGEV